tara:strand:- start:65 stop:970 length:906 start_codon:yes stop_codon:yes gene_type:complete
MEEKKEIVVVGSVAYDDVKTIKGDKKRLLGGSGTYFSIAASLFTKVNLVGVVGDDFNSSDIEMFNKNSIDTKYLKKEVGSTFHWGGIYSDDFSERETIFTNLGVFENFDPEIDSNSFDNPILFLANIQPSLQMKVINQVNDSDLVVLDTMNLWIENNLNQLIQVIKKSDILLINDEEAIQITNENNLQNAGEKLLDFGLRYVIIKKGGKGSMIISDSESIKIPAVPNIDVYDPTGAGDSFAGGFLGYLSKNDSTDIINAVIHGTAVASYTVSNFGIKGIENLELHNLKKRVKLINNIMKDM